MEPNDYPEFLIYIAAFFYVASLLLFHFGKLGRLSVFFLFSGTLALGIYLCHLDHYLRFWDEEFHALVAKNLLRHPLLPTLREKVVLPNNYTDWVNSHLWLHKQPLFLWQMAASLYFFGINEVSVRIPSAIMVALLVFPMYRIGKIVINERVGYYAAFIFSLSYFAHELAIAYWPTDHNDIAFVFYITCSIWAFLEYEKSNNKKWLLLIGIFSGCALLVKWLVGLLIYFGWGLSLLFNKEIRMLTGFYLHLGISLLVTALVVLPWQIYSWIKYPLESWYEYHYAKTHFTQGLDGHTGDAWFHFDGLAAIYGQNKLMPYLMIGAFVALILRIKNNTHRILFFFSTILVYTFYTLANTKMAGYVYVVSFVFYVAMASVLDQLFIVVVNKIPNRKYIISIIAFLLLLAIGYYDINLNKIKENHLDSPDNYMSYGYAVSQDTKVIKQLGNLIPSDDYVLFNCKKREHIAIMFYTNFNAYDQMPSKQLFLELKARNIKMAYNNNGKLPDYILQDSAILKVKMDAD